jgi:hypothetical protein
MPGNAIIFNEIESLSAEQFCHDRDSSVKSDYSDYRIGKASCEVVKNSFEDTIHKYRSGSIVLLEIPSDNYFNINATSVKYLTDSGFEGIYISFQRPLDNLLNSLKNNFVDTEKLVVIDYASVCAGIDADGKKQCKDSSGSINIKQVFNEINNSLNEIDSKDKFVFVDSISTLALYKSPSEILKIVDFLYKTIHKNDFENIMVIFNTAYISKDREIIKNISYNADEVINIMSYVEKFIDDTIKARFCT